MRTLVILVAAALMVMISGCDVVDPARPEEEGLYGKVNVDFPGGAARGGEAPSGPRKL